MGTDDLWEGGGNRYDGHEISHKPHQMEQGDEIGPQALNLRLREWVKETGWKVEKITIKDSNTVKCTFSPDPVFRTKVHGYREYGALSITKLDERLKGVEKTGWVYELVSMQNGRLQCTFSRGGDVTRELPVVSKPRAPLPGGYKKEPPIPITMDKFFEELSGDARYGDDLERASALARFFKQNLTTAEMPSTNIKDFNSFFDAVLKLCRKVDEDWDNKPEQRGNVGPPLRPECRETGMLKEVWKAYCKMEGARIPEHWLKADERRSLAEAAKKIKNILDSNESLKTEGENIFEKINGMLNSGMSVNQREVSQQLQEANSFIDRSRSNTWVTSQQEDLKKLVLGPKEVDDCGATIKSLQGIVAELQKRKGVSDEIWVRIEGKPLRISAQKILDGLLEMISGIKIARSEKELAKWKGRIVTGQEAVRVLRQRLDSTSKK